VLEGVEKLDLKTTHKNLNKIQSEAKLDCLKDAAAQMERTLKSAENVLGSLLKKLSDKDLTSKEAKELLGKAQKVINLIALIQEAASTYGSASYIDLTEDDFKNATQFKLDSLKDTELGKSLGNLRDALQQGLETFKAAVNEFTNLMRQLEVELSKDIDKINFALVEELTEFARTMFEVSTFIAETVNFLKSNLDTKGDTPAINASFGQHQKGVNEFIDQLGKSMGPKFAQNKSRFEQFFNMGSVLNQLACLIKMASKLTIETLAWDDVFRLRAFITGRFSEFNPLTVFQGAMAFTDDRTEMNEQVFT